MNLKQKAEKKKKKHNSKIISDAMKQTCAI